MTHRVWQGLATLIVLVLLFVPRIERPVPRIVWLLLLILTLTYGFSLFCSTEMPAYRRFSIGYLTFVGVSYVLAGVFGLIPNWDLFEIWMWNLLISPYPLLTVLKGIVYTRPFRIDKLPYTTLPIPDRNPLLNFWFSIAVTVVGVIAVAAAVAMAKRKKAAYNLWLALVGLSILEAMAYVLADAGKWGMPQYRYNGPSVSSLTIVSLCWAVSYAAAYLVARTRAELL